MEMDKIFLKLIWSCLESLDLAKVEAVPCFTVAEYYIVYQNIYQNKSL